MSNSENNIFNGRYRKIDGNSNLGKGSYGKVSEVKDTKHEFQFSLALKQLSSPLPINVSRFSNEIKALKDLSDIPGIMPLLDFELDTAQKWYLMPKMQPFNIKYITMENLSVGKILEYYLMIAKTLCEIHSKEYFHRDIKPDNLFINEGIAYVGDFGLTKLPSGINLTPAGKKLGPHFFIAPEMLTDADKYTGDKADVYSLAKSLWCSLVKQEYPMPGEYSLDLATFWVHSLHNRDDLIGIDLLLRKAMIANPANRISMSDFKDELELFLTKDNTMTLNNNDLFKKIKNDNELQKSTVSHKLSQVETDVIPAHQIFKSVVSKIDQIVDDFKRNGMSSSIKRVTSVHSASLYQDIDRWIEFIKNRIQNGHSSGGNNYGTGVIFGHTPMNQIAIYLEFKFDTTNSMKDQPVYRSHAPTPCIYINCNTRFKNGNNITIHSLPISGAILNSNMILLNNGQKLPVDELLKSIEKIIYDDSLWSQTK